MKYSLLDEPLITIRQENGTTLKATLPQILERLTNQEDLAFMALQPHQKQAWFSFLVQLAAIAVTRINNHVIAENAERWRQLLLKLSDDEASAWALAEEDVSKPAFMQTPIPEGSLEEAGYLKNRIDTPDQLDMLVTSKNHELKMSRIQNAKPEHWLFALVTLQTMEGIMGRGNYGIVRMNGGYGNRPHLGYTQDIGFGARFSRNIRVLTEKKSEFEEKYNLNGAYLLWLQSWDGSTNTTIPIYECDPYFIEICRRVRFGVKNDSLIGYRTNTDTNRVKASKDLKGMTDDPWTPIDTAEGKALTVSEKGFSYDLLQEILFGDNYKKPISLQFLMDEGDKAAYLVATSMARGQGKTDGLHQRILNVPSKQVPLFSKETDRFKKLGDISKRRVAKISEVNKLALRPALSTLIAGGKSSPKAGDAIRGFVNRFNRNIDHYFFEFLWQADNLSAEEAEHNFESFLKQQAEKIFYEAEETLASDSLYRWKAISAARAILNAGFKRSLHALYSKQEQIEEE